MVAVVKRVCVCVCVCTAEGGRGWATAACVDSQTFDSGVERRVTRVRPASYVMDAFLMSALIRASRASPEAVDRLCTDLGAITMAVCQRCRLARVRVILDAAQHTLQPTLQLSSAALAQVKRTIRSVGDAAMFGPKLSAGQRA